MTFEALGEDLLTALPSLPLYSISLHNDRAQLLWVNEGELGPPEQSFAEEALQVLGAEPEQPSYENVLQDGRAASVIPVRTPRGDLLGLVLIVHAPTGEALDQLMTPQLRTILRKLSVLMRPSIPGAREPVPRGRVQRARSAPEPRRAEDRRPTAAPEPDPEPAYEAQEAYPAQEEAYAEEAYAQEGEAPADEGAQYPQPEGYPNPEEAYAADYAEGYPAPEPEPAPQALARQARYAERRPVARAAAPAAPARTPSRETARPAMRAPVRAAGPRQSAARARVAAAQRLPHASRAATQPPAQAPAQAAGRIPPGYRRVPQQAMAQARTANRGYAPARPQTVEVPPLRASAAGRRLAEAVQARQTAMQRAARPVAPAVREPRVMLELLPFVNLRQGSRGRRFEVLPKAVGAEMADGLDTTAVQELIGWLGSHRGLWSLEPTSFTINLSITTLEDERFLPQTAQALRAQGIQAETLGFEIAEALYTQNRALVERFVSLCDKTGCFLAIDDFSFDPGVLSLLRSRAVRLVKVDAKLTGALQRDKLSEALVTAIIQATRVLGVQCAAKAVESQSLLQWLTAAGCDVAQGPALSGPQPLEALGSLG